MDLLLTIETPERQGGPDADQGNSQGGPCQGLRKEGRDRQVRQKDQCAVEIQAGPHDRVQARFLAFASLQRMATACGWLVGHGNTRSCITDTANRMAAENLRGDRAADRLCADLLRGKTPLAEAEALAILVGLPLLGGGWTEYVRAKVVARDAGSGLNRNAVVGGYGAMPCCPLPDHCRLDSYQLSQRALSPSEGYSGSNGGCIHALTLAALLLFYNSYAHGVRRAA